MLQATTMANEKVSKRIGGAPEWVREFLQRIEDRDEVRDATAKLERGREHKATMDSLADLAGSVGQLGGSVGRIDKKVDGLRDELVATRQDVAGHGTRLASLEKDLRDVPDEVRQNMAFTFVATMDEVLRLALLSLPDAALVDRVDAGTSRGDGAPVTSRTATSADAPRP